ncbi:MAG: hypothetical protein LBG93_08180 [Treponema sp.]|jgi:hypothetical protein|nr:hypothetical protein [Treponema sp.]MDR0513060.1 hypothetical protein [Treponema sp.]
MIDVPLREFDYAILEQSAGASAVEAILIVAMVAFLVWTVKLALDEVKD